MIYELLMIKNIKELDASFYLWRHLRSGAKIVFINNNDDNRAFFAAFRTPATDDSGIPHILEHLTMCGSTMYNTHNMFAELAKGAYCTYLNALTYPDRTVFPVCSLSERELNNVIELYLNSIFFPLFYEKKELFYQEAWRLENERTDKIFKINGIVYNEMKGVYSSLTEAIFRYARYHYLIIRYPFKILFLPVQRYSIDILGIDDGIQ